MRWQRVVALVGVFALAESPARLSYVVVDTGQQRCFDNLRKIGCPAEGQEFYGQDASYE
ncbi:MAG: hypothetical protein GY953_27785, partial [bacterium]|nr:hypothetical protein [bacterium]